MRSRARFESALIVDPIACPSTLTLGCKCLASGQVQCLNTLCQHALPHRVAGPRLPGAMLGIHIACHGCNNSLSGRLPDQQFTNVQNNCFDPQNSHATKEKCCSPGGSQQPGIAMSFATYRFPGSRHVIRASSTPRACQPLE